MSDANTKQIKKLLDDHITFLYANYRQPGRGHDRSAIQTYCELLQLLDVAQTDAHAEGRNDERAEVLHELLEWEAEYMQQARGGDRSGKSDSRADAAREIHDHLRASWETRERDAQMNPATDGDPGRF